MVLVEAAAVAVAAARVFARVASLDMRARRASASARRRASSLRTRGGFEGGGVLDENVVVAVECHDEAAIALAGEHPRRHAVRVARAHVAPSERRAAPRQSSCARPGYSSPFETLPRGCQL